MVLRSMGLMSFGHFDETLSWSRCYPSNIEQKIDISETVDIDFHCALSKSINLQTD